MTKQITNEEEKSKFWNIRQLFKKKGNNKQNDIITRKIKNR